MRHRAIPLAALTGLLSLAVASASQAQTRWTFDREASSVTFRVRHLVVSTVEGRFAAFDVRVTGAAPDFADASISATVELASVATGDRERDEDILKPAFFDAARFPRASFRSTRVEPAGRDRWRMSGELTLKGTTRPVTFDVRREPDGRGRHRFRATATVDRFDFGIRHNPVVEAGGAVIARDVDLSLEIALEPDAGEGR